MSRCIVSVADTRYISVLNKLISSVNKVSDIDIHVTLVDCSSDMIYVNSIPVENISLTTSNTSTRKTVMEYRTDYLKNNYTCYEEVYNRHNQRAGSRMFKNLRLLSQRDLLCIHMKYVAVDQLIETYDQVLLLDADTIVNHNPEDIFTHSNDITISSHDRYKYKVFHEDVTCFTKSSRTCKFIKKLVDNTQRLTDWQADQMIFRDEYYNKEIDIDFNILPEGTRTEYPHTSEESMFWANMKDV